VPYLADTSSPKDCAVNLDHIQTVSKQKIGGLVATLAQEKMNKLRSALLFALGFGGD
jgi:mRNA interferase MazF